MDIIILALPRADSMYSSTSLSLAKGLAKKHRVFYVENPFTYSDYYKLKDTPDIKERKEALLRSKDMIRQYDHFPDGFHYVIPGLTIPINWMNPGPLYERMARINDQIVYKAVKRVIEEYAIEDFIFVNSFNPFYGRYFPASFKPKLRVYHTVDDISQAIFLAKHGTRLEEEYIRNSDLTLTTSSQLREIKSKIRKEVYCIPNAADVELFMQAAEVHFEKPEEFSNTRGRVIIYVGNIKDRLNFSLCARIARANPENTLMFVGPVNTEDYKKEGLHQMKNVIFTGPRPLKSIPAYLQHADCAVIPFKFTRLTKSIYPLKINEYLASGIPVISTGFSDDIRNFSSVARIEDQDEEFIQAIAEEIESDSEEKRKLRIEVARKNSWDSRVEMMRDIMYDHLTMKNGTGH